VDVINEELLVKAVDKSTEACRCGVQPGMKIVAINGEPVHHHGTDSLARLLQGCGRDSEITFAVRKGSWHQKANKRVVKLAPPLGLEIPFLPADRCYILTAGPKARQVGITAGVKIIHVKQNETEIWADDLHGKELCEAMGKLTKGVDATITIAVFGTGPMGEEIEAMNAAATIRAPSPPGMRLRACSEI